MASGSQFDIARQIFWEWWGGLQGDRSRGARAQVRRATRIEDVLLLPLVQRLYRRCGPLLDPTGAYSSPVLDRNFPKVAAAGMVVAAVTEEVAATPPTEERPFSGKPLAELIGPSPGDEEGKDALLKPLRFRRLLQADDADPLTLARDVRRAVMLLDRGAGVDVGALGASVLFWGPRVRTRWAFDYYQGGDFPASPEPHAMGGL